MSAWTVSEREKLFRMREANEKWIVIAFELNRSEDSCRTFYRDEKRRESGIKRKSSSKPVTVKRGLYGPPAPSPDYLYLRAVSKLAAKVANDQVAPKIEKPTAAPFGTCSIQRLASHIQSRAA